MPYFSSMPYLKLDADFRTWWATQRCSLLQRIKWGKLAKSYQKKWTTAKNRYFNGDVKLCHERRGAAFSFQWEGMAGVMDKDRETQKISTVPSGTEALKGWGRQKLSMGTEAGEKLINPLWGKSCKKLSAEFVTSLLLVNHTIGTKSSTIRTICWNLVGEFSLKCGKETLIQNFIYSARWHPSCRNYLWGNTNTSSKQQVIY